MGKSKQTAIPALRPMPPRTPDAAVREYGAQLAERRAAIERAEADGLNEDAIAALRELLAADETMLARAQAWATRSARHAAVTALPAAASGERRRRRVARVVPLTARDAAFDVVERRVPDPYEPGTHRHTTFNRRVDILEEERANRRITESQYLIGRMVQAVFERASGARLGSGGWNASASRDQTIAHELQVIYGIEDAETVRRWVARVERQVGMVGTRFLRQILAERVTLKQYAEARGKAGERGTAQVGAHFRILLESLDEAWQAKGRAIFDPADRYDEAAASVTMGEVGPHARVYADPAAATAEEVDEHGVVVPAGRGYRWGRSQGDPMEV